jgi:methylated-DNA-protein-cysteine methyltransferase-like protein
MFDGSSMEIHDEQRNRDGQRQRSIASAERVYEIVARIPSGKVTTYGSIARQLGSVRGARMVGWILNNIPEELDLPCHRVVNRYGYLSGGWHFGHPDIMKARLVEEDVPFCQEYQVDLTEALWLPWEDEPLAAADEMDDLEFVPGAN